MKKVCVTSGPRALEMGCLFLPSFEPCRFKTQRNGRDQIRTLNYCMDESSPLTNSYLGILKK